MQVSLSRAMAGRTREEYKETGASLAESRDIGLFTIGMCELLWGRVGIARSRKTPGLMPRTTGNQVLSSGRTPAPCGEERTCRIGRKVPGQGKTRTPARIARGKVKFDAPGAVSVSK